MTPAPPNGTQAQRPDGPSRQVLSLPGEAAGVCGAPPRFHGRRIITLPSSRVHCPGPQCRGGWPWEEAQRQRPSEPPSSSGPHNGLCGQRPQTEPSSPEGHEHRVKLTTGTSREEPARATAAQGSPCAWPQEEGPPVSPRGSLVVMHVCPVGVEIRHVGPCHEASG